MLKIKDEKGFKTLQIKLNFIDFLLKTPKLKRNFVNLSNPKP